ncbi:MULTISPECIES: PCYCGC motif-containing (lipo)protein [Bacillus]|uniref:PCYCGC motif-containing (lipo)protein n=1 Tax=Bacillus TaxID=1386 RepID=UPI000BB6AFF5|nr:MULTISPECIES: PCYCGC motif-containing (lipo)protein [Bacillus]
MKKILFIFVSVFLLIGCSNTNNEAINDTADQHNHEKPSFMQGDIREKTDSLATLPNFLTNQSESIVTIYQAAANYEHVLEYIPCYCGCGTSVGHRNSYECFVHENIEDGSVVWDDHGTRCGVCLETAALSVSEFNKGTPLLEIREMIDTMYKEGYAKPTNTPMPPSN